MLPFFASVLLSMRVGIMLAHEIAEGEIQGERARVTGMGA
jgi:hypothetical protein